MKYEHVEDILLSYAKFGVKLEDIDMFKSIKISVPKDSYIKDNNGNPICGESLAKQFSDDNMELFGSDDIKPKILFKIRDEYWTRELEEEYVVSCMLTALKMKRCRNNR